uniref:hypothetical protein n=1 Tax=Mariniphaga sediminis TaxID=1628158 RepID=UPI003564F0B3
MVFRHSSNYQTFFKVFLTIFFCGALFNSQGQNSNPEGFNNDYFRIVPGSENSTFNRVELFSDIDTTWEKWKIRGYNFGFNPKVTPMYTTVNGILSTPYMIQVRGNENERNKKRWGFHVFEGYA